MFSRLEDGGIWSEYSKELLSEDTGNSVLYCMLYVMCANSPF